MPTPSLKHCDMRSGSTLPASTAPDVIVKRKAKGCNQLGSSQSQSHGLVTQAKTKTGNSPVIRNKAAKSKIPVKPFSAPRKKI
ncbi:hypothetical protein DCAR_0101799 [Daucus carota subsp. sativus]|uniref:Uncharacterized protein n=1 Tax=Daucus carota subsp. sativus TaxID=79200 RepID=A0A166GMX7_DAUCS|nr:hypothetical protein DCAR_0101799 [Daucus carota subsp. sativus]